MENNKETKPMDKFLAVENKINSIFDTLMNRSLSEGDRMTHFLETKPYLEKLKATLHQLTETGDSVLKGKSEVLLLKIEEASKEFGAKYLGVKVDEHQAEVTKESPVVADTSNTPAEIDSPGTSTYIVIVEGQIFEKFTVTQDELLRILNDKFADKNPIVIEGTILNLKAETKTVYTL